MSGKDEGEEATSSATSRKRLHLLYLLNDVLHHTKCHTPNSSLFSIFSGSIQPYVVDLVQLTARGNRPRIRMRIDNLLQIWEEEAHFGKDYVGKLRESVVNSATGAADDLLSNHVASINRTTSVKDQPYVMPASHGDLSTPYHDLPAGNMMPHIMPNRSVPIRPDDIRALQFVAGPADDTLVAAVKDFMAAVGKIDNFGMDGRDVEGIIEDVDELGQPLLRDESGELVAGSTYYGWSREFCERMKTRGVKQHTRLGRESSYSSSRSRSRSPRKRKRYSRSVTSTSSSFSRSRSRGRSAQKIFRSSRRDYSSPGRAYNEDQPGSQSPSKSQSIPPAMNQPGFQNSAAKINSAQIFQQSSQNSAYPLPGGLSTQPATSSPRTEYNQRPFPPLLLGPGNIPIPPPPPAYYSGTWPPPPPLPPPPPPNTAFNVQPGMLPYHVPQGFPTPRVYQKGQQQYGGSDSSE